MALISRETGEIYAQVLNDVNGDNLRMVMDERLDVLKTHLQTDSSIHYKRITGDFLSHEYVDHSAGEYVRGDVSTNIAENYVRTITSAESMWTATSPSSRSATRHANPLTQSAWRSSRAVSQASGWPTGNREGGKAWVASRRRTR